MGIRKQRGTLFASAFVEAQRAGARTDFACDRERLHRRALYGSRLRQAGFTLAELLIAVAIVGILAAIALPSYQQQILRANRAQAKQFLEDIANRQEQYLLDQRAYTTKIGTGGLGMTPPQETTGRYSFAALASGNDCVGVALPAPGYSLTATAIGAQATDGNLCIDSVNHKTPTDKWQR
jgi:type IV pilus assembly protein PilE